MKPFLRLPVSAAALAGLFLLGIGLTRAADSDEPAHLAAAESLVTALHTEQMVDLSLNRMLTLVDRFSQSASQGGSLTPEQTDSLKKAEDEARDTIRKELGYPTLKDEFVKSYAEAFTEPELKELAAFYSSPVGKKFVEKQSAVTDKVGQVSQQKIRVVMPGVVQKLREVAQKTLPPPPAAPEAPLAPPSPLAPPVPPTPPVSVTTPPVSAVPPPMPSPAPATTPPAQ